MLRNAYGLDSANLLHDGYQLLYAGKVLSMHVSKCTVTCQSDSPLAMVEFLNCAARVQMSGVYDCGKNAVARTRTTSC